MPQTTLPAWAFPAVVAPVVGSFLTVVITRLPSGGNVITGRSVCPKCGHTLGWLDIVPLLSWLWRRGRCRFCGASISLFYPAVELAAVGIVAWAAALVEGPMIWASCLLGWTLLALGAMDQRERILANALTLPLVPAGLAVIWLVDPGRLAHHALGAVAGLVAFAGTAWLYERLRGRTGLGLGDAKLLAAIGAWVGWIGLPGVVAIASVTGLAAGLLGAVRGGRLALDARIAFGPHLCFAAWIVWLYGPLYIR
jgi:leader peptidase (prepilin peptidase)/N-methyltransferase